MFQKYSHASSVIDACCGDGVISYWLAKWNPSIRFVGIDIKMHDTWNCHRKHPNLTFICGDIASDVDTYKDSSLMIINSLFVLEDPDLVIGKFKPLFPLVFGIFPYPTSLNFRAFTRRNPLYPNLSVMSKERTVQLFARHGYTVLDEQDLTYIPYHHIGLRPMRLLCFEVLEEIGLGRKEAAYWLGVFSNKRR
jgi:hypothetical protein